MILLYGPNPRVVPAHASPHRIPAISVPRYLVRITSLTLLISNISNITSYFICSSTITMADDLSVSSLFSFKNHVVLITGGASGLGEMAAQAFVQNGARVIIASRKEKELEKTSGRLNGLGPGKCEYVVADLKDKKGCDALVAEVKKKTDRLTVLLNNSGATWGADYYDFPESGWDKLFALNVKSIFYVTVGLEPLLLNGATAEEPSRVINIASIAGIQTTDVTAGEEGGLAPPGTGTYSCKCEGNMHEYAIWGRNDNN